jgi:tetratricopeptide (TPR) repeat protein
MAGPREDCAKLKGDKAIRACDRVIGQNQRDVSAYINRALQHIYKGEYDHAIADLSKAIEINPKSWQTYHDRSIAYFAKKDFKSAIADETKAIEINPKSWLAYYGRGLAYRLNNDPDRAIADYNKAIEHNPRSWESYNNRGNTYQNTAELDRAISDYTKAIALNPNEPLTYKNRGVAWFVKGDFKKAAADQQRSLERKGDIHSIVMRYLARARTGEDAKAELAVNARRFTNHEWPFALIELHLSKITPTATLDAAAKPEERCVAQFHIGQWHILNNSPEEAEAALKVVAETCPVSAWERNAAVVELMRMMR